MRQSWCVCVAVGWGEAWATVSKPDSPIFNMKKLSAKDAMQPVRGESELKFNGLELES
jgi:hypothetical protein